MILLSGADISIRQEGGKYIATAIVGNTSKQVTADDPVRALGLAVMLQAGFTEGKLVKALGSSEPEEEKFPKNTNFIPRKGQKDFLSD